MRARRAAVNPLLNCTWLLPQREAGQPKFSRNHSDYEGKKAEPSPRSSPPPHASGGRRTRTFSPLSAICLAPCRTGRMITSTVCLPAGYLLIFLFSPSFVVAPPRPDFFVSTTLSLTQHPLLLLSSSSPLADSTFTTSTKGATYKSVRSSPACIRR